MGTASQVLARLETHGIRKAGHNRYRCKSSPLRTNSDSDAFAVSIHDEEHGTYYDHRSGEGGSLYELARILGVDLPERAEKDDHTKRGYEGLEDYAIAHGVPLEIFEAAGWKEVRYQTRRALEFQTTNGPRWRFLDGESPHYKSPSGYKACWYGLDRAIEIAEETRQPLVICNGEASTIAAQYRNVPACAVTSGEKAIPPDLLDELRAKYTGSVIIAPDCDPTGRKSGHTRAGQLRTLGYSVRVVDLNGNKGCDLADFAALYGTETMEGLQKLNDLQGEEDEREDLRFKLIHASELDNRPPVQMLIDELPANRLTVLVGDSEAGKSFLSLGWAAHTSHHAPVIYVAAEDADGYAPRKLAWEKHNKMSVGELYFIEEPVNLFDENEVDAFLSSIGDLKPALIIFDTLNRCAAGAEENSSRDMSVVINNADRIRRATNSAVLLNHHNNKSGGYRGSSAILGNIDSMIEIQNEDGLITVKGTKSKNWKRPEPRHLRMVQVPTGRVDPESGEAETSCVLLPASDVIRMPDELSERERSILETLAMSVFRETGAKTSQIAETLNLKINGSLYRILSRLKDLGYIDQAKKFDPFFIQPAGLKAVGIEPHDEHLPPAFQANGKPFTTDYQHLPDDSKANYQHLPNSANPPIPDSHVYHTPLGVVNGNQNGKGKESEKGKSEHGINYGAHAISSKASPPDDYEDGCPLEKFQNLDP